MDSRYRIRLVKNQTSALRAVSAELGVDEKASDKADAPGVVSSGVCCKQIPEGSI